MKKLEYRMYGFVPYNISPIQQGIQFGHAVVEYAQKHFKDAEYQSWAKIDKTFIILNGGTTNAKGPFGMQVALNELNKIKIKNATFFEPDLNDALTSIVFLVDERVFDKKKYPNFMDKDLLDQTEFGSKEEEELQDYDKWLKTIGGKQNEALREFLSKYRLA